MTRSFVASFLLLFALASAARAQASDVEQRVRELEAQVRMLMQEVERLRAAQPAAAAPSAATAELERKVEVLTEEMEQRRLGVHLDAPSESRFGLGPSASKVYAVDRGVSIGGYGEMLYESFDATKDDGARSGKKDTADFLRAVLYFGYKFSDHVVFNSEIEFEHGKTGPGEEGEVAVEFANVDFLLHDAFNVRAGLMLMPVGFVNEMHEPPTFLSARRPDVERVIIPSTWRENGVMFFGSKDWFSYRVGAVTGLDATGFTAGNGLRGGRQNGSKAKAEDLAAFARLDFEPAPGLLFGVSGYHGGSGQDIAIAGEELSVDTTLWDAHLQYRWRGLQTRWLFVRGEVDEAAELNDFLGLAGDKSVGSELEGWYGELGYDVLAHVDTEQELIPFARREAFDTQAEVPDGFMRHPANDRTSWTWGVAYKPHPQVVIKLDYLDLDDAAGTGVDQVNLGVGYSF